MRPTYAAFAGPVVCLAVFSGLSSAAAAAPGQPAAIPPVERADRHFEAGATYLRALPEGTKVTVKRADGSSFALRETGGRLATKLPAAKLSPDRKVVTTPLGFKLSVRPGEGAERAFVVEAPNGNWSQFVTINPADPHASVLTKGRQMWTYAIGDGFVLRLPDGTRVDTTDTGRRWEAMTLGGERMRLEVEKGEWTALPTLPSPPLIPDLNTFFVCRNGETWRLAEGEDHLVFAWNWYPVGFAPADAVEDVRARRKVLDAFFAELALAQEPFEMAGYLLGRRLALSGGDTITFEVPGAKPATVYLLPDSIDPPSVTPRFDLKYPKPALPRR